MPHGAVGHRHIGLWHETTAYQNESFPFKRSTISCIAFNTLPRPNVLYKTTAAAGALAFPT